MGVVYLMLTGMFGDDRVWRIVSDESSNDQIISDLIHYIGERYGQRVSGSTIVVHPGPRAWKSVTLLQSSRPGNWRTARA